VREAWRSRLWAALVVGAAAACAAILLRFPPTVYSFYPQCPIHEYLHLQCPGCGATRALAALLQGRVAEALHFNALFVVLLPVFAGYAAVCCYRMWRAVEFRWPQPPRIAMYGVLVMAVVFTVARNL
jgi:Protein of unknown function (DUF2752)